VDHHGTIVPAHLKPSPSDDDYEEKASVPTEKSRTGANMGIKGGEFGGGTQIDKDFPLEGCLL